MALFLALASYSHLIDGFMNRDLRFLVADLLDLPRSEYTAGKMTYDLRRLRLKGIIARAPGTNRYFLTPYGWKLARLFSRLEARLFRPAMAAYTDGKTPWPKSLLAALKKVDKELDILIQQSFPKDYAA